MNFRLRLEGSPFRYERGPSSVLCSAAHDPSLLRFVGVYWLKTYWFPNLQPCQWSVGLVVNKFGLLSLTFNVVIDYVHTYIHKTLFCLELQSSQK